MRRLRRRVPSPITIPKIKVQTDGNGGGRSFSRTPYQSDTERHIFALTCYEERESAGALGFAMVVLMPADDVSRNPNFDQREKGQKEIQARQGFSDETAYVLIGQKRFGGYGDRSKSRYGCELTYRNRKEASLLWRNAV